MRKGRMLLGLGMAVALLSGCVGPVPGVNQTEDTGDPTPTETCCVPDDPLEPGPTGPTPSEADAPDQSNETLEVLIEAEGHWRVAVPLPVSEPGTSAHEWAANLTLDGDGETELVETGEGTVLQVAGDGNVTLASYALQPPLRGNRCCAEAYLDAEWSAGKDDDGNVQAGIWDGGVILELRYEAGSDYCSRSDHYVGEGTAAEDPTETIASATGDDDPQWFPLGGERRAACS